MVGAWAIGAVAIGAFAKSIHDNIGNDFEEVVIDDWNASFR